MAPMASTFMSTIARLTAMSNVCARSSKWSIRILRRSKRFMGLATATATPERASAALAGSSARARPWETAALGRLPRLSLPRRLSPLTLRILAINVVALALLGGGLLYLGEYQQNLIVAQIEALKTQGQIFAAALGGGAVDNDQNSAD